ncbi:hypothetical protein [Sedimentibacter sp.]|uniref:hypothetical protein n=1 Tax=Sedimentibacter sp. TaxID=1960295 RepID=UPI0028AB998A|nr:hypothetical protein [Sedimentibacter sp.]
MQELFLKTEEGLIPLDEKIIKKYNLKAGRISPFSRFWIVDKSGNIAKDSLTDLYEGTSSPTPEEMPKGEGLEDDEIVEFEETGAIFSQSEIIDFSRGVDSEF